MVNISHTILVAFINQEVFKGKITQSVLTSTFYKHQNIPWNPLSLFYL